MSKNLVNFTDILGDEIYNSQPLSIPSSNETYGSACQDNCNATNNVAMAIRRPQKCTGQQGHFRSVEEIDPKYRGIFTYPFFNLVQSSVIEDALYSDKSMVVCAPTGSGKTVVFEMAIVQLLMELEDKQCNEDFKIIYMAPVKALCTEKLTEWYPKLTKLGLLCIEVTGDTDVDFSQLKPYRLIITTPEKWDMLTRRWRDHKGLVEVIKLFLIDEVHILNDEVRGPVLEAVVSRMRTIESSAQSAHRIEQLQKEIQGIGESKRSSPPRIRFVAVSATVSNPEDVAAWLGTPDKPAVFFKFGDECRPVKLKRIVEGYPCPEGTSIFKFDIILNYKLWPVIQKYHDGKPTLIFCNTRKSVVLTAETLSRELTINFNSEQKAKLTALASTIKNKKLQSLVMSGVGCHHAGLLFEERMNIERAFRNRDLPILITTTTLAMGVNLPAHLVIIKNTQQYVNGAYQEYSISTVLQMVGRAGRPQFDTEATAVIMTRLADKPRYQSLVGGSEPLQSYLHKRLPENLNSEAALGTVGDVAQCVQWLRSTFLFVRAARDPKRYLGLPQNSPQHLISKKVEELCVKAMNGLATSGLITMDDASCIESTEAGRLMSVYYLDLETMKHIMKIEGSESLERLLWLICESHELADMHLRVDERRCLNALNRNNTAATIRFPMKGKITTRQMKLNCVIQAVLGCLPIPDPSLGQEAMKIMRIAERVCKCLVAYVTKPDLVTQQPTFYSAVLNTLTLKKCVTAHLWENSPFVSKQLKGIGPTFSTLLATAGKVNFMLLEESHPRDLERIMNKGPPAGNVLRKQISLLPKYKLTISPIDEKTITLQLFLVNASYLAENIENLTAGENHKSYIVVGDSNNHILLLTSFKDKDLISIYDGTMKYDIKRKHDFEHKVFAHCISSTFVGIDVQAEYSFNDLRDANSYQVKKSTTKQTCITDTFKERKRKNNNEIDITQSKEKKKRENAIVKKINSLKDFFGFSSKESKPCAKLDEGKEQLNKALSESICPQGTPNIIKPINFASDDVNKLNELTSKDVDCEEDIDNEQINSILFMIEDEISKTKSNSDTSVQQIGANSFNPRNDRGILKGPNDFEKTTRNTPIKNINLNQYCCKTPYAKRKKNTPSITKSDNYNFIELLERNLDLSDDEKISTEAPKHNTFSESIKCHIDKYLQKTQIKTNPSETNIEKLLRDRDNHNTIYQQPTNSEPSLNYLSSGPGQYTIKEILEPIKYSIDSSDTERKANMKNIENFIPVQVGCEKVNLSNEICIEDSSDTNMIKESKKSSFNNSIRNLNNNDSVIEQQIKIYTGNISQKLTDDFMIIKDPCDSNMIQESNKGSSNSNLTDLNSNTKNKVIKQKISTTENTCPKFNNDLSDNKYNFEESIDINIIQACTKGTSNNNITYLNNSGNDNVTEQQIIHTGTISQKLNEDISDNIQSNKDTSNSNIMQDSNNGTSNSNSTNLNNNSEDSIIKRKINSTENTNQKLNDALSDNKYSIKDSIDMNMIQKKYMYKCTDEKNSTDLNIDNKDTVVKQNISTIEKSSKKLNDAHNYQNCIPYSKFCDYQSTEPYKIGTKTDILLDQNSSEKIHCGTLVTPYKNSFETFKNLNNTTNHDLLTNKTVVSEDYFNDKMQEYINNYSLSAIKIDIFEKDSIKAIRKIEVDVKVSEIISKNINFDSRSKYNKEKTSDSNDQIKSDLIPIPNNKITHDILLKENKTTKMENKSKYINNLHITECLLDTSEYSDNDKKIVNTETIGKEADDIVDIESNVSEQLEPEISMSDNHGITDKIGTEEKDLKHNMNKLSTSEKTSCNSKTFTESKMDKLKNIFQKYSSLLGKDSVKSTTAMQLSKTESTKYNKIAESKPKRPFKISDIHKLQSPLPKELLDLKPTDANVSFSNVEKDLMDDDDVEIETDIITENETKEFSQKYERLEDIEMGNTDCNTGLDYEALYVPINVDLEPCHDYKIDNSMFDPKTLLQCVVERNSDEIIPPPPEFCDESNYPPDYNEYVMADNYSPSYEGANSKDMMAYDKLNDSIFEDNGAVELTPSKEIETWTLSQNDYYGESTLSNSDTIKSFTIMHQNTLGDDKLNSIPTRVRLENFKFSHKNTLKIRR